MNVPSRSINPHRWFARTTQLIGLAVIFGLTVCVAAAAQKASTVRLVVDYGDGVQVHFMALPWSEGMTVLEALTAAQKHPRGITFTHRGSGSSALITAIGNLKNEGGGETAKNWLFYVNDKQSEVGVGTYKLKSGDAVLWKFQTYD